MDGSRETVDSCDKIYIEIILWQSKSHHLEYKSQWPAHLTYGMGIGMSKEAYTLFPDTPASFGGGRR